MLGGTTGKIPEQIEMCGYRWNCSQVKTFYNARQTKICGDAALYERCDKVTHLDARCVTSDTAKTCSDVQFLDSPPDSPMGNPQRGNGEGVTTLVSKSSEAEFLRGCFGLEKESSASDEESSYYLILGLDTEYDDNGLVSVQFYTDGKAIIFYLNPMSDWYRLEIQTFIRTVFELLDVPCYVRYGKGAKPDVINVSLVAHFSTADLSQFGFRTYDPLRHIQKCGRGYASVEADYQNRPVPIRDSTRNKQWSVRLNYRDTMSLVDGGSLKQLGDVVGVEKIELPDGAIERMGEYRNEDPKLFTEYALNDAIITHEYASIFAVDGDIPPSAPALATKYLKHHLESRCIDVDTWRGLKSVELEGLEQVTGLNGGLKHLQVSGYEPCCYPSQKVHDFFSRAYRGGLNQCYSHGWEDAESYDLDLCNAYPTFLACVPDIDYTQPPVVRERIDLTPVIVGDPWIPACGCCDIELPDSCMFPPVAVSVNVGTTCGLVAPLTLKEVYITAPEAFAVLAMGGRVFAHEWIEPVVSRNPDMSVRHTMAEVMSSLVADRSLAKRTYGKGSTSDKTMKLVANSMYGKLAQGLSESTAFDAGLKISTPKPISSVTNVVLAAMATAQPRAFLSLLMQMVYEQGFEVYSVTTDGFITTATAEQAMDSMQANEMAMRWVKYIEFVRSALTANEEGGSNPVWMECKHENPQGFMNVATRINMAPNIGGVCAHTGYKSVFPDKSLELRQEVIEKVVNRKGQVDTFTRQSSSLRDLVENRFKPLEIVTRPKKVSMDYDYKRKPINPETTSFDVFDTSHEYLHFGTVPYKTIEEFARYKQAAINRKKTAINSVSDVLSVEASATNDDSLKSLVKLQREHEKKLSSDQKLVYAIRAWSQDLVEFGCGKRKQEVRKTDAQGKEKTVTKYVSATKLRKFLNERGFDADEVTIKNACRTDKKYLPPYELYADVVDALK